MHLLNFQSSLAQIYMKLFNAVFDRISAATSQLSSGIVLRNNCSHVFDTIHICPRTMPACLVFRITLSTSRYREITASSPTKNYYKCSLSFQTVLSLKNGTFRPFLKLLFLFLGLDSKIKRYHFCDLQIYSFLGLEIHSMRM